MTNEQRAALEAVLTEMEAQGADLYEGDGQWDRGYSVACSAWARRIREVLDS